MESGPNQRTDERSLLQKIASGPQNHRGFRHNLAFYDSFDFNSPHGRHQCMVTEVLSFSVNHIREMSDDRRVTPSVVKRIAKQVLLGLEYLHDVCGIVHAGMFGIIHESKL